MGKDTGGGGGGVVDLPVAVAAGVPPDLSFTQSYPQTQLGVGGVVVALNDYLKVGKYAKPDNSWKLKWGEMKYRGRYFAVPYNFDDRVIYFHSNIYLEAGRDPEKPPETWAEFETAIEKTKKMEGAKLTRIGFDFTGGSGGTQQ